MDNGIKQVKYFHNPDQFEFTEMLKLSYVNIKQEWSQAPRHIRRTQSTLEAPQIENIPSKWDVVFVIDRGRPVESMRRYFPVTMNLINTVKISQNLLFSVFYPGLELIPHLGFQDICRVHLGIDMNDQSALICGGEKRTLENGEVLVFEDGQEHYAYNKGSTERTILCFDILKADFTKVDWIG